MKIAIAFTTIVLMSGCFAIREVPDSTVAATTPTPDYCLDSTVVGGFQHGSGASDSPYVICNLNQLNFFTTFCNVTSPGCAGLNFLLGANIDLSANGNAGAYIPVKRFSGTFGGNNKTVSNWTYAAANLADNSGTIEADIALAPAARHIDYYAGFIRLLDSGSTVKNLALTNVSLQGRFYTGALTGFMVNGSTVQNCSATTNGAAAAVSNRAILTGRIVGYNNLTTGGESGHTGGLIGGTDAGTTITGSSFAGIIVGAMHAGGLIGRSFGSTVTNCHTSGAVYGTDGNEGGLIGALDDDTAGGVSAVSQSYSTMDVVTNSTSIGGLIGSVANRTSITTSYYSGTITGGSIMGGIAGNFTGAASTISKCYSTGAISGGANLGGLVGLLFAGNGVPTLSDSYALNTITFTANNMWGAYFGGAGGAVGSIQGGAIILRTYAAGSIVDNTGAASTSSGDLIGGATGGGTVTNSYGNTLTSPNGLVGSSNSTTLTQSSSLTSASMRNQANYTGWDFNTIWQIAPATNSGYPTLR